MSTAKEKEFSEAHRIRLQLGINLTPDEALQKDIIKLINRLEKIISSENTISNIGVGLDSLVKNVLSGKYFAEIGELFANRKSSIKDKDSKPAILTKKVIWELLEADLTTFFTKDCVDYLLPSRLTEEIVEEKFIQEEKIKKMLKDDKRKRLQMRNDQPVFPGKWKQKPFPQRTYEALQEYHITGNIAFDEVTNMEELLSTPLNGFLGQAYNYDDHQITEDWMYAFVDKGSTGPSEDDVIRTQIAGLMEIILVTVQDRVCTENGVLTMAPLGLGNDLKEVPVWGIDCYTRRMVEIAIDDRIVEEKRNPEIVKAYIEQVILPAINDQSPDKAHNMNHALNAIYFNPSTSPLFREFTAAVYQGVVDYGQDSFRIHPKGTGVVCINTKGIPPHVFVTEYLGELYPSYRWCERLDVVEQAQRAFELKPTLPDFYNILLERPRQDPAGYGLMFVDASQKANMGSSCSHSCDPNCTSAVVARNGKLVIVLTTNRHVNYGEELTMDYYSITFSDVEWRAAICLCGKTTCRGSFLHYATQNDLQQVLNQNCGPLWRFAALLRSCTASPISQADQAVLTRHGMKIAALGNNPPLWMRKYAADNLKFVEYERKGLPCALLRAKDDSTPSLYTFGTADMDARTVMEQRIQSLVCCFSLVHQAISSSQLNKPITDEDYPLVVCKAVEAVLLVWERLMLIPDLMEQYLLTPPIVMSTASNCSSEMKHSTNEFKRKTLIQQQSSVPNVNEVAGRFDTNGCDNFITKHNNTKCNLSGSTLFSDNMTHFKKNVIKAVQKIRDILDVTPSGLLTVHNACFSIREILLEIKDLSNSHARLGQLADILVFWANTSNFSYAREYDSSTSRPVDVYARELGNNIPRNNIDHTCTVKDYTVSKSRRTTNKVSKCVVAIVNEAKGRVRSPSTSVEMMSNDVTSPHQAESLTTCESLLSLTVDNCDIVKTSQGITDTTTSPAHLALKEHVKQTVIPSKSEKIFYGPNEIVYTGTVKYHPLFAFWQLMGWYKAGTDDKCTAPDLFGCVQLPDPACCFGEAEMPYGNKQRDLLISRLSDDKVQMMSWPSTLQRSFSIPSKTCKVVYGSPMLDVALGEVGSTRRVLATLQGTTVESLRKYRDLSANNGKGKKQKEETEMLMTKKYQPDNIIPPEMNTSWIQCDSCKKWRRLPWHVNADSLPETWDCTKNDWDADRAKCELPQDIYDADQENTVSYCVIETLPTDYVVGSWRDVYCTKNKIYYEAQIMKVLLPENNQEKTFLSAGKIKKKRKIGGKDDVTRLLFHFKGWSHSFDEWIEATSERIEVHNLHTNPAATCARDQEKWQGVTGIRSIVRSAFNARKPIDDARLSEVKEVNEISKRSKFV